MLQKMLCAIGLHGHTFMEKWVYASHPGFRMRIVTEYKAEVSCPHCGKVLDRVHLKWNGENMEDADNLKPKGVH